MEEIFLPVLHSFENNNVFSGSSGMLRFVLTPNVVMKNAKEVDLEKSSILAQLWHGLYCLEKSTVEQEKVFPMSEAGREEIRQWLMENR
jgi:hypothetical protein